MENKKVLVAYGTRYGSAGIAAGDIRDFISGLGHEVTLVNLRKEKAPSLPGGYDLVVAGSSVAMFSWIGRVKSFLRRCARAGVPTAVYITAGTAIEDPGKARERFMDRVIARAGLSPVQILATGPVIDFRPGGLDPKVKGRIRGTIEAMLKDDFQPDGLMDTRDMAVFNGFLESLKAVLA